MTVSKWNQILQEKGHGNLNICTPQSPLSQNLKSHGFTVIEWSSSRYFSPKFTFRLRKLLEKQEVDVLLLQNLRDLWIVSPALYGFPKIQLMAFAQMLVGVNKTDFLHRQIYKPLRYLFTLTKWQESILKPRLPLPPEKYRHIPNFVDTSVFHPSCRSDSFRAKLGFQPEDFLIGVIGRIDEQKGQWELMKAFSRLIPKHSKIHLLVVGEPTRGESKQQVYYKKLLDWVTQQKLQSKIHFLDFQKDPQRLFANMDLFVLPSHQETFGYVVVEAMASGTPVLATNSGGVPEILEQGKLGCLCQPKSISDLEEKMETILKNPEEKNKRTLKALEKVRNFYDREKVYESFVRIIDESF